jgi:hypothetical protein
LQKLVQKLVQYIVRIVKDLKPTLVVPKIRKVEEFASAIGSGDGGYRFTYDF